MTRACAAAAAPFNASSADTTATRSASVKPSGSTVPNEDRKERT
ncbi:hypothetical protein JNB_01940 [Janibacter sp. HTCC2649]|nr:hypothetical protein [Janibacter sp. HTCC2649]EAP98890.1 hypothetical protein JNB_01940 [Janibacter sp. HTCC2649]